MDAALIRDRRVAHTVPRDASSQFRSLAWLLLGAAERHEQVRVDVANQLHESRQLYAHHAAPLPGFDEWLRRLRMGAGGDLLTLQAAADRYRSQIRVVFAAPGGGAAHVTPLLPVDGRTGALAPVQGEIWLAMTQHGGQEYYRPVTRAG